jgi:hypothetical protein
MRSGHRVFFRSVPRGTVRNAASCLRQESRECGRERALWLVFLSLLNGNNVVRGFRNTDIREGLYESTEDAEGRRRQSAAVGRSDVEAVARARADPQGAAQPTMARQPERPSSARRGSAIALSWKSSCRRSSGLIHRKVARTAQRWYGGRLYSEPRNPWENAHNDDLLTIRLKC